MLFLLLPVGNDYRFYRIAGYQKIYRQKTIETVCYGILYVPAGLILDLAVQIVKLPLTVYDLVKYLIDHRSEPLLLRLKTELAAFHTDRQAIVMTDVLERLIKHNVNAISKIQNFKTI